MRLLFHDMYNTKKRFKDNIKSINYSRSFDEFWFYGRSLCSVFSISSAPFNWDIFVQHFSNAKTQIKSRFLNGFPKQAALNEKHESKWYCGWKVIAKIFLRSEIPKYANQTHNFVIAFAHFLRNFNRMLENWGGIGDKTQLIRTCRPKAIYMKTFLYHISNSQFQLWPAQKPLNFFLRLLQKINFAYTCGQRTINIT